MPVPSPTRGLSAASFIRTAPVAGETTASWITRCAAAYHLPPSPYLRAVLQQEGRAPVNSRHRLHAELYLNAAARERVAAYSRIEEQVLARVLPAWPLDLDVLRHHNRPAAHWQSPIPHTAVSVMAGCLTCTASRSRGQQVWQYREWNQRICRTHRIWLVGGKPGYTGPTQIPLDHLGLGEAARILAAHRRHQNLTHPDGTATAAWQWARGIIQHLYTGGELTPPGVAVGWNERLDALTRQAGRTGRAWPWRIIARDLVTYPETLALTEALTTMAADADASPHTATEEHMTGLLTRALGLHTAPAPTPEAHPLARWLARHCREDTERWLNSRQGDTSAVPLHVKGLTWALKRHSA